MSVDYICRRNNSRSFWAAMLGTSEALRFLIGVAMGCLG